METNFLDLLYKYDKPVPRYTSYPTVPYWDSVSINEEKWKASVKETFEAENGEICLYMHLPFCENLCTFCACNKRITVNHAVEEPYLETLLKEWKMYCDVMGRKPLIREIHLGGGTPTFFSPENLKKLIEAILKDADVAEVHEFSVEVHPNFTKEAHIKALAEVGFNRISLGVQDFDPEIQFIINRNQSYEKTLEVVEWARKYNYFSINTDLIFGLPKQQIKHVAHTIELINKLNPDRIAFYSYAHVPWKSKVQRRYSDDDVPKAAEKWQLYNTGRALLMENGFLPIGMDHFAKKDDKLFIAEQEGKLHRNFMGYTTTNNKLILALGASSISDSWNGFIQNVKVIEDYQQLIGEGKFPIEAGHLLSREDVTIRQFILDLMCRSEAKIPDGIYSDAEIEIIKTALAEFESDNLIKYENGIIHILPNGHTFIRNICATFDVLLNRKQNTVPTFSRSI